MRADPNSVLGIVIQSCMDMAVPMGLAIAITAIMIAFHERNRK